MTPTQVLTQALLAALISAAVVTTPTVLADEPVLVAANTSPPAPLVKRGDRHSSSRRRPPTTAAYRAQRARWHEPAPRGIVQRWANQEVPPLVLIPAHETEHFELTPESRDGGFSSQDLTIAANAFRHRRDGKTTQVHPRLLDVIYDAALHFNAPYVNVVSGYRTTRATSRHFQGRAADIVLPGVTDQQLAAYLRRQGFVGVGLYPVSGFVHIDVRNRSYFWVDRSGPGQPARRIPMMQETWARFDAQARKHGTTPTPNLP